MYRAQFQKRKFFSRNNNASDEQLSLALQYVSYPAPSALPDKETREWAFVPPSLVLDALKSPVKVGPGGRVKHERPGPEESERSLWQW